MGLDTLDPKLVAKMTELDKKYNPVQQQLTTLQDIASMIHELLNVADDTKAETTHLKAIGAVLEDSRQQLIALNKKETPEAPDYSKPVVEAVNKLSKEITNQLNKIDVKPDVKVAAPQVNVQAPEVNVAPAEVNIDLTKIEKILKNDIPKAFDTAIKNIPQPQEVEEKDYTENFDNLLEMLKSIDTATRMKPLPGTLKVTNPDGSSIGSLSGSTYYESYTDTTTDVNLVYLGKATPGSATSDAAWQIKRYNKTTGQMSFADDVTTFTKQWSARTGYSY